MSEASDLTSLLCCPICKGATAWCGDVDPDDIHDCHFIVCVGQCKTQFDTVAAGEADNVETIDELKEIAARKFNARTT